ncbi:hypothetical protein Hanom_Chr12g01131331 [Helianthus anomalus]
MWDKNMKDVNLIELSFGEPSQAKLELDSLTNRAEPSWLVYNRANFERALFEFFSSEFRASYEPRVF